MLRSTPKFQTVFEPAEVDLLRELSATVADSLMDRAATAPKDELAEITGMPSGHADAPEDPRLARLLPNFMKDDAETVDGEISLLRQLNESDIVRSKLVNIRVIIDSVEAVGNGSVQLTEAEAHQWVAGLNDLRLFLHATIDTIEDPQQRSQTDAMYQWLSFNQESLLEALASSLGENFGADAGEDTES